MGITFFSTITGALMIFLGGVFIFLGGGLGFGKSCYTPSLSTG
jgi:hypothetical protein